ncbi:hypothetical protein AMTRI_Chr03g50130 [Amborella trichopoda]
MAHKGEIGTAGDGERLYMKDDHIWTFATAGLVNTLVKKFVTVKVKKGNKDLLCDDMSALVCHLAGCVTLLQVNSFCFANYSLFLVLDALICKFHIYFSIINK